MIPYLVSAAAKTVVETMATKEPVESQHFVGGPEKFAN